MSLKLEDFPLIDNLPPLEKNNTYGNDYQSVRFRQNITYTPEIREEKGEKS